MAREIQVTFDCADPAALAAMGIPSERRNDAFALVDPDGAGPRIYFQRVPEGKAAKNRVQVQAVGATRLARVARVEPAPPLGGGHIVMADPEGNEFCLD